MRLLLFLLWFLFITSASFWLPAHEGEIDQGDATMLVPVYAVVAGLAAIAVRGRAQSVREALDSALPALALLGAAAVWGYLLNEQGEEERGAPIFLYFGIALWSSWAALVVSTAVVSRTKWNGLAGIGVAFLIAILGLFLVTAQVD
jgi:hypothetical protein